MSTTQELVERLKARLERVQHTGARGYHLPVDAELDRAAAARLSELERENAALKEAVIFTRDALFSALAGSNAAGDAEAVDDVLHTLQWMADHLNPAYSLCVAVLDGRPPAPHFQKNIDAKRAEYAAAAALAGSGEK